MVYHMTGAWIIEVTGMEGDASFDWGIEQSDTGVEGTVAMSHDWSNI